MQGRPPTSSSQGFTAVEMLVAIAIIGILAAMGIPLLQNTIHRTKMEGLTNNVGSMMRLARSEAIKHNVQTVMRFDLAGRSVQAFIDRHGENPADPEDGVFNPDPDEPVGTTDKWLGNFELPAGVELQGPGMMDPIDGFTTVDNDGVNEDVAIFLPDGSITNVGAFRFGDARLNFFEVRVAPQGTARVQVRKWDDIEAEWFEKHHEDHKWTWN